MMKNNLLHVMLAICVITFHMSDTVAQKAVIGTLTPEERDEILRWHNFYRGMIANGTFGNEPKGLVKPLEWNDKLAQQAHDLLENHIKQTGECPLSINSNPHLGENVAHGARYFKYLIEKWTRDLPRYNYDQHSSFFNWYFMQMIWGNTKVVGCAVADHCGILDNHIQIFLTCLYYPRGNIKGEYPYEKA